MLEALRHADHLGGRDNEIDGYIVASEQFLGQFVVDLGGVVINKMKRMKVLRRVSPEYRAQW